jgi:hypothetical protein
MKGWKDNLLYKNVNGYRWEYTDPYWMESQTSGYIRSLFDPNTGAVVDQKARDYIDDYRFRNPKSGESDLQIIGSKIKNLADAYIHKNSEIDRYAFELWKKSLDGDGDGGRVSYLKLDGTNGATLEGVPSFRNQLQDDSASKDLIISNGDDFITKLNGTYRDAANNPTTVGAQHAELVNIANSDPGLAKIRQNYANNQTDTDFVNSYIKYLTYGFDTTGWFNNYDSAFRFAMYAIGEEYQRGTALTDENGQTAINPVGDVERRPALGSQYGSTYGVSSVSEDKITYYSAIANKIDEALSKNDRWFSNYSNVQKHTDKNLDGAIEYKGTQYSPDFETINKTTKGKTQFDGISQNITNLAFSGRVPAKLINKDNPKGKDLISPNGERVFYENLDQFGISRLFVRDIGDRIFTPTIYLTNNKTGDEIKVNFAIGDAENNDFKDFASLAMLFPDQIGFNTFQLMSKYGHYGKVSEAVRGILGNDAVARHEPHDHPGGRVSFTFDFNYKSKVLSREFNGKFNNAYEVLAEAERIKGLEYETLRQQGKVK